jgi:ketosteroid isomerase-like protein
MSQENIEIVRQVYEAFNRGDWDAVYRDYAEDAELTTPPRGLDAGIFRGRGEGQAYWEDFLVRGARLADSRIESPQPATRRRLPCTQS